MFQDSNPPLNILLVGAGLGGLTAALALRLQGHKVTIFESSRFSHEAGAAIHVCPNANGLLKRFGVDIGLAGSNPLNVMRLYNADTGAEDAYMDMRASNKRWQHDWLLCHRARLHSAIRQRALDPKAPGPVPELRLASRIASVDPIDATVTLEGGEVIQGDVIIGADGVHSICRQFIPNGRMHRPVSSGTCAYRCMIPMEELRTDPECAELFQQDGTMAMFMGEQHKIVFYPCIDNTVMNVAFIHKSSVSELVGQDGGWNVAGHKGKMMEIASGLAPIVQKLLSHATDGADLKVWTFLDMSVMHEWTCGKLALLGDAAHPFLPHQGQGAAQAMEDAASLAVMLSRGLKRSEVPARLKLYESARMQRANYLQEMTRQSGLSPSERKRYGYMEDPYKLTTTNFGHDEWDHSTDFLEKHLYSQASYRWRAPLSVGFGPAPGPRQPLSQLPDRAPSTARQGQTVASIKFKTSRTYLQRLLPTDKFSFSDPATVAYATLKSCTLRNMTWLGGRGYTHFGLYIDGIQYRKQDGGLVNGVFLPILFENLPDSVQTGTMELGFPKVWCEIDVEDQQQDAYAVKLGWHGNKFAEFRWNNLRAPLPSTATQNGTMSAKPGAPASDGLLVYRYVPAVGKPGEVDAAYPVLVPTAPASATNDHLANGNGHYTNGNGHYADGNGHSTNGNGHLANGNGHLTNGNSHAADGPTRDARVAESASVSFERGSWDTLPTLHNVARFLAEMPIYEVVEAKVEQEAHVDDLSNARRVD